VILGAKRVLVAKPKVVKAFYRSASKITVIFNVYLRLCILRFKLTAEIQSHSLVPSHEILDEEAGKAVLMQYGVDRSKLPKIRKDDPALPEGGKIGDIIKITRNSPTAGVSLYYRVVVE